MSSENSQIIWQNSVSTIKDSAKVFLSMAMAVMVCQQTQKI